ncbi:hypothetical protein KY337_03750 [Candidatus Woesearchaeota archaeon]|nr:hypothetical protein [Candidatus Woesearchaeota archaeon]
MDFKEKIISFITSKGPLLPRDIVKEFKLSLTLAGAYLSELVSSKKIMYSQAKIGGSPLYFLETQRNQIEARLSSYLNQKDRDALEVLKNEKILPDKDQTPLIRVSLRNIKDFAVPLTVNLKTSKELYWKWHLTSNEEAETIIRSLLERLVPTEEAWKDEQSTAKPSENLPRPEKLDTENLEKTESKDLEEPKKAKEQEESQQTKEEKTETKEDSAEQPEKQLKKETKPCEPKPKKQIPKKEEQVKLKQDIDSDSDDSEDDEFYLEVSNYLTSKNISIKKHEVIKKKSEIDLVIKIETSLGDMDFYCKARNKKRCNEADLSTAFVQGELRKLPVIFLTTGDLTKKAKELLSKEFKNIIINKIEVV